MIKRRALLTGAIAAPLLPAIAKAAPAIAATAPKVYSNAIGSVALNREAVGRYIVTLSYGFTIPLGDEAFEWFRKNATRLR